MFWYRCVQNCSMHPGSRRCRWVAHASIFESGIQGRCQAVFAKRVQGASGPSKSVFSGPDEFVFNGPYQVLKEFVFNPDYWLSRLTVRMCSTGHLAAFPGPRICAVSKSFLNLHWHCNYIMHQHPRVPLHYPRGLFFWLTSAKYQLSITFRQVVKRIRQCLHTQNVILQALSNFQR